MSDGKFELFLTGGIGSIVGALMTVCTMVFKAGRRDRDVDDLRTDVNGLTTRMEKVESAMADGRVSFARIETTMDHVESHVTDLKAEVRGVNARLDEIFGEVGRRRNRLTASEVRDLMKPQPGDTK